MVSAILCFNLHEPHFRVHFSGGEIFCQIPEGRTRSKFPLWHQRPPRKSCYFFLFCHCFLRFLGIFVRHCSARIFCRVLHKSGLQHDRLNGYHVFRLQDSGNQQRELGWIVQSQQLVDVFAPVRCSAPKDPLFQWSSNWQRRPSQFLQQINPVLLSHSRQH